MVTRTAAIIPEPAGEFVSLEGEEFYRISAPHRLPPFLMNIPSDSDLWMFVSSWGGLTAGRVDADGSLFPYETADKLYDGHFHTGPLTMLRVRRKSEPVVLWQPLAALSGPDALPERNLYKNTLGNRVVFEEIHPGLQLAFRYRWSASEEFGLVRTASLVNLGSEAVDIALLDGLRNVLPYGVPLALQQQRSCLIDAYKRTDCDPATRLATFALTAKIVDRPAALEELRANTVWCAGLEDAVVCLSADAATAFARNEHLPGALSLTGRRGNYFVVASFSLQPGARMQWHLCADIGRSHVQVAALRARLLSRADLGAEIDASLSEASANLRRIVGSADGLQLTGHREGAVHHFANVLFNNMRGGVFAHNYRVERDDFLAFLQVRNRPVLQRQTVALGSLSREIALSDLLAAAARSGDADFARLAYEYLPLYFGRRHGDPSRPWNQFSIRVRNQDGSPALHYEGNWRDIFQNWEALSASFPDYIPSIIAKFVNASTVDGFNPYRIGRDGIDWETVHADDPWSCIGYWGDHQIVYLLRFLAMLPRFAPGALQELLGREIYTYAEVPYRLAPYADIVANPRATITYDADLATRIAARVEAVGTDGKLIQRADGSVYCVNLLEKLLVPALSKLSNLVPDAGIWMNTQRPEWNDANNALVGNGVSMVTLCYLRQYWDFLVRSLEGRGDTAVTLSAEVGQWLQRISSVLAANRALLAAPALSDHDRQRLLDALGGAFSEYRQCVYARGFSGKVALPIAVVVALGRDACAYLDHAIRANRRADGLYNAYNLLTISAARDAAAVQPLEEMLEGQVAVLSSGVISAQEALQVLSGLFASQLYRRDQRSFLLYPDRELPGFLDKNVVPEAQVQAVPLLRQLLDAGDHSVLERDVLGVYRFHGDFRNTVDVATALDRLALRTQWEECVAADRQAVLDLFESVFNHRSFTGRSSTMYGYEGLGSVYWHMVSKLLLAVQEIALRAAASGEPAPVVEALAQAYYRIRSGLGFEKTVREFGAFPTDPYSHTPAHAGAQQPGMTGQVKEEILTRWGELGIEVENGAVRFRPALLRRSEFLSAAATYDYYDVAGAPRSVDVPAGGLAFSMWQVPVVYVLCREAGWLRVTTSDGAVVTLPGDRLDAARSRRLFRRSGAITKIEVGIPERSLCQC